MKTICAIETVLERIWKDLIKPFFEIMCWGIIILVIASPCFLMDWLTKNVSTFPEDIQRIINIGFLVVALILVATGFYYSIKGIIGWIKAIKHDIRARCEVEHDEN